MTNDDELLEALDLRPGLDMSRFRPVAAAGVAVVGAHIADVKVTAMATGQGGELITIKNDGGRNGPVRGSDDQRVFHHPKLA